MSKYIKVLIFILIVIGLVVGGVRLIKKRKEELAHLKPPEKPVYIVKGTKVKKGNILISDEFLARYQPVNQVKVATKVVGYIKNIYVEEGQPVKKGQLLAVIDSVPLTVKLQNLKLEIENMSQKLSALKEKEKALSFDVETKRKIYERNKVLYQKKALSKEKLELSETAYKLTAAKLAELKANEKILQNKLNELENNIKNVKNSLSYTKIYSPVNGIVDTILKREGNLAVIGKPIMLVEDTSRYELKTELPLNYRLENIAFISLKGGNIQFKNFKVLPSASQRDLKVVKIYTKKLQGIPSNSIQHISINREVSGFIVPRNAILHLSNGTFVLTVKDGKFVKIPVKLLGENEKYAVISGNITESMPVAVAEESKLRLLSFGKKGKLVIGAEND